MKQESKPEDLVLKYQSFREGGVKQVVKFEIRHGVRLTAEIAAMEREIDMLSHFLAGLKLECQRLRQRAEEIEKRGAA